jgi:hypothetical protein
MNFDDYVPRPTIAKMKKDPQTKIWEKQLIPEEFFGRQQFGWKRTDASWNYLKNSPLVDMYRGNNSEQVLKHYQKTSPLQSLVAAIQQLEEANPNAIAPGFSFKPVVGDRQPRVIYWDTLCQAAILEELLGNKIKIRPYEDAQGAREFGASYYVDFPASCEENAETQRFTWAQIPAYKNKQSFVIATTCTSDFSTAGDDRLKLKLRDVDGNRRQVLNEITLAAYFRIMQENQVAQHYSMIPYPTQELVDVYTKCRNNLIMNVRETDRSAKPGEYHANIGEINRVLGQKIKQNPKLLTTIKEGLSQ